jgi:FkbM family methyltransferase
MENLNFSFRIKNYLSLSFKVKIERILIKINYFTKKLIIKIFSKLNKTNKRDLVSVIENFIFLINGKNRQGYNLQFEVDLCCSFLKRAQPSISGCIIDVGANKGNYTKKMIEQLPNYNYFLFEPQKQIFNELKKNLNYSNVRIFNFGLFSKNIRKIFFIPRKMKSSLGTIYERTHEYNPRNKKKILFKKSEVLNFRRFDQLKLNLKEIDLVKIDTEGAELEVLFSFGNFIKNIKFIQFEFGRCNLDSKTTFLDFYLFFKKNKYTMYRIQPGGLKKINDYSWNEEIYISSNFICANNRIVNI